MALTSEIRGLLSIRICYILPYIRTCPAERTPYIGERTRGRGIVQCLSRPRPRAPVRCLGELLAGSFARFAYRPLQCGGTYLRALPILADRTTGRDRIELQRAEVSASAPHVEAVRLVLGSLLALPGRSSRRSLCSLTILYSSFDVLIPFRRPPRSRSPAGIVSLSHYETLESPRSARDTRPRYNDPRARDPRRRRRRREIRRNVVLDAPPPGPRTIRRHQSRAREVT